MRENAAGTASEPTNLPRAFNDIRAFLGRKVWLPKLLYHSIPYFYVLAGFSALLATFYISEWFWVLPHYLLFSIACVHFGILVYRRRRRRTSRPSESESPEPDSAT